MLSSNPAFTSNQVISLAFHQPAPLTAPASPSTQGTQSTQRPLLSIVLVFKERSPRHTYCSFRAFRGGFALCSLTETRSRPFAKKSAREAKNYWTVTRANLRLPTCATTVLPLVIVSALSVTFSPSSLTPPCSIMRTASAVLGVRPDCLSK